MFIEKRDLARILPPERRGMYTPKGGAVTMPAFRAAEAGEIERWPAWPQTPVS
jgi:hypothetical protein